MSDSNASLSTLLATAAAWIKDADAILITAGAGMSVPAGVDYFDKAFFAKHYPAMVARGYSYCYELVGNPALGRDPRLLWGYMMTHAKAVAGVPAPHPVYSNLRKVVGDKPYFVVTTNADGLFTRAESPFERTSVFTPQGSWNFVQCMKPCADDSVFPAQPYYEALLPLVDSQLLLPEEHIPKCPRCGGPMMFNLNAGAWYRDTGFAAEKAAYRSFLRQFGAGGKKLTIIEIGVGWNTPGVLRFPNEQMTATWPEARLIRVNMDDETAAVPEELDGRAVALAAPIEHVLTQILSTP